MKYSSFRRDVKHHVLTFSTSGQCQVRTCCTMCSDVSKEMSHFRLPSSGRRCLLLKVPNKCAVTCYLVLHTCNKLVTLWVKYFINNRQFTPDIKGKSSILTYNSCYRLCSLRWFLTFASRILSILIPVLKAIFALSLFSCPQSPNPLLLGYSTDFLRPLFLDNRPFYRCVPSYLAMNASEAGGDLALIQTSLLFSCKCQLVSIRPLLDLHNKSSEVCIKTRLTPTSLSFRG